MLSQLLTLRWMTFHISTQLCAIRADIPWLSFLEQTSRAEKQNSLIFVDSRVQRQGELVSRLIVISGNILTIWELT